MLSKSHQRWEQNNLFLNINKCLLHKSNKPSVLWNTINEYSLFISNQFRDLGQIFESKLSFFLLIIKVCPENYQTLSIIVWLCTQVDGDFFCMVDGDFFCMRLQWRFYISVLVGLVCNPELEWRGIYMLTANLDPLNCFSKRKYTQTTFVENSKQLILCEILEVVEQKIL